jgi:flavin reductase (DIM6/NTAB) family NADH-FMN oxidoreductase RutF
MKKINPTDISENAIRLIGSDWMLISAGDKDKFNTMTASWGAIGFMWNKPCVFFFIRPQRYTFEFAEKNETLSLSFFDEKYRKALGVCGSKSGRDTDKIAEAGITPAFTENGTPYFVEAKLVLECRKMYAQMLNAESFIEKPLIDKWYPEADFHKMYVAEIVGALQKQS